MGGRRRKVRDLIIFPKYLVSAVDIDSQSTRVEVIDFHNQFAYKTTG